MFADPIESSSSVNSPQCPATPIHKNLRGSGTEYVKYARFGSHQRRGSLRPCIRAASIGMLSDAM